MELQASISNWFPVQFTEIYAPSFINVSEKIFEAIDWQSVKTEKYSKNAETTYFSNIELPFVDELKELIQKAAENLAKNQGVNIEKHKAVVSSIWMNNMRNGSAHEKHVHGSSVYSGTYYVRSPEGSGSIRFHNPSLQLLELTKPPIEEDNNSVTCSWVDFKPKPGLLLLWNSWVSHEVLQNYNKEPRISISFNINFVQR